MPPYYKPLATSEEGEEESQTFKSRLSRFGPSSRTKSVLFSIVATTAVMYALYLGSRSLLGSLPRFRHGARPGCGLHRHRNLTALPSHYTLPSGDKIPSVALGTVNISSGLGLRSY